MAAQIGILTQTVLIAAGQSLSAQVNLGAATLAAIYIPAGWTAAQITFQASPDGGATWGDLFTDLGAEVTFAASASRMLIVDPTRLRGVNCLKLRSGVSGATVNQVADATLTVFAKL